MNNPFQIFNHPRFGDVRVAIRNGELIFVGSDVARALNYARPDMAIKRHVHPSDKSLALVPLYQSAQGVHETNQCIKRQKSGQRRMVVINESGLYALVLSANTPEAQEFKHWVTSEVLPAIRQTGSYSTSEPPLVVEVKPPLNQRGFFYSAQRYASTVVT